MESNLTVLKKSKDLRSKNRAYVESLFSAGSTDYSDLPDDYDPLDVIAADNEFDLSVMMDKAIDPITGLPRDIRLPEGDFKEAKNYFDWCENFVASDDKFPFARQIWAAIHLLGEYCPRCSHPKWKDIFNVNVSTDPKSIPGRVQLLNYGVCPKCKATKREMWLNKELHVYVEAAWLWGQRSGKSTVTSSLTNYITHKYLKFPKMSSICEGIKVSTPLTATFVGVRFADALATLWEPITKGFVASPWFCLAEGTSISLADGTSKTIETMKVGDEVKTLEGTNLVTNVFDNGRQECFDLSLANGNVLTGTDQHKVRCLSLDGVSLVWKKIGDITVDDFVLTDE